MSVALVVLTDGRHEYLTAAMDSAAANLPDGAITERWMFDDTGDDTYRQSLAARFPTFTQPRTGPRLGFAGAMGEAWRHLAQTSKATWVFHLEQDFIFARGVELGAMVEVMQTRPYLAQIALRRQPVNAAELAAGGVVERWPDSYTEFNDGPHRWLEHRLFWTCNPCLYRRTLCGAGEGWPHGPGSEARFGRRLLSRGSSAVTAAQVRFGYWGARGDQPHVEHIGQIRKGSGY